MRYAITFETSDNWQSVDTIIMEDKNERWAELGDPEDRDADYVILKR